MIWVNKVQFVVTQIWKSNVMTQREENLLEQDTIATTLDLNGKHDIGHVISGEQVQKLTIKL